MRALRRPRVILVLFLLAIAVVVVAAQADHRHKQAVMNRLELSQWYCTHGGTRCGKGDPDRVERRWNQREMGYKASVVVLACGAAALLAVSLRRRR
jgi:hypothetical protein